MDTKEILAMVIAAILACLCTAVSRTFSKPDDEEEGTSSQDIVTMPAATNVTTTDIWDYIHAHQETTSATYETDENGEPIIPEQTDENGEPIIPEQTDENGNPIVTELTDESGNVIEGDATQVSSDATGGETGNSTDDTETDTETGETTAETTTTETTTVTRQFGYTIEATGA